MRYLTSILLAVVFLAAPAQASAAAAKAKSIGHVQSNDFHFTKTVDKSSPN